MGCGRVGCDEADECAEIPQKGGAGRFSSFVVSVGLLAFPTGCECSGSGKAVFAEPDASEPVLQRSKANPPVHPVDIEPMGAPDAGPPDAAVDAGSDADLKGLGSPPDPVAAVPTSLFCGDAVRGEDEECDDGNTDETDACTSACTVRDFAVVPAGEPGDAGKLPSRWLGWGRHPIGADGDGFAVAYIEPHGDEASVGLAMFDAVGVRRQIVDIGSGSTPQFFADPVVAALSGDAFAVAWTEFGGDGDALGIALRRVDAATGQKGVLKFANEVRDFSQFDADMVWTGSELVVAWADDVDAVRGPDLRYRRFDANLQPLSGEETLAATTAIEGGVVLTRFTKGGWAAAWREGDLTTGLERVVVANEDLRWRTNAFLPGPAESKVTLVELDPEHLHVSVTIATDPGNDGVAEIPKDRHVILDTESPGDVQLLDLLNDPGNPIAPWIPLLSPAVVRSSDRIFLSATIPTILGPPDGDALSLSGVTWEPTQGILALDPNIYDELPRLPESRLGDQRFPALAVATVDTQEFLYAAWDDHFVEDGAAHGEPDVMAQVIPLPLLRTSGDGGAP
jgi:cysteine-rich repeat protein